MTRFKAWIRKYVTSPVGGLIKAFDIRDVFFFCGLPMLGYGLHLKWGDWLAYMVCGIILTAVSIIMQIFAGRNDGSS